MKKMILPIVAFALGFAACTANQESAAPEISAESSVDAAQQSKYQYEIIWEAFKTPAKKGVKGGFTEIKLDSTKDDGANFPAILEGAVFDINGMSVQSGDNVRDNTLKNNFFSKLLGNITGKFGTFKDGKVLVKLTMAGISKDIELQYQDMGDSLKVNGSIDLIKDFKAENAFNSLHEGCKDLHEGKTWTDVSISALISK